MDEKSVGNSHEEVVKEAARIEVAQAAAHAEHASSVWSSLRHEWKSALWSMAVSTAIIMEGYDIVLVTSLFAQSSFTERFGYYNPTSGYQIDPSWQSALGICPTIGAIAGAFLNGWLTHRFGYRKVLITSLIAINAFIFLLFFATSLSMILVGLILCGMPWGVFATMAPAYASEVCSLNLRGYLTIYVNLCWALGQLIAAGVLEGFASTEGQWAYRIPFAIQWAWPLPLLAVIYFAPESPWWLVEHGKLDEAIHSIQRLSSNAKETAAADTLALIQHTNQIEKESQSGTSYLDCFRGVDLRRTEIICMVFAAQVWCGSPLGGTPAYFFVQAGLSSVIAFKFSVGGLGLASLGTIASWFLISSFGRRTLYVWGLALLGVILLIVGIVAAASKSSAASYTEAGFIMAWLLIYYLTVGPVCYAIIAETSAMRLRNRSVCLSRIAYYISQVVGNVIEPYMINPTAANWKGITALFWAGTCALFFVWAFFRLPETRDRSYEELDILFQARVNARQFSKTHVDPYADPANRTKPLASSESI